MVLLVTALAALALFLLRYCGTNGDDLRRLALSMAAAGAAALLPSLKIGEIGVGSGFAAVMFLSTVGFAEIKARALAAGASTFALYALAGALFDDISVALLCCALFVTLCEENCGRYNSSYMFFICAAMLLTALSSGETNVGLGYGFFAYCAFVLCASCRGTASRENKRPLSECGRGAYALQSEQNII